MTANRRQTVGEAGPPRWIRGPWGGGEQGRGRGGAEDKGKRYKSLHLGPQNRHNRPGAFAQALRPNARETKNGAAAEAPPPFPGTRRGSHPQPFFPVHRGGASVLPAAPLKIRRDNALKEIKNQFIREPRRNEGGC